MKGLTQRQGEVLSYIQEHINKNNVSPTYREIQKHFEFTSLGSVAKHVETLKKKGVLYYDKNSHRSLIPIKEKDEIITVNEIELPFIGYISFGIPIETFPKTQKLAIPSYLVQNPDRTYVLRARGESLHEEMISDGDLLLIEVGLDARDGETVLAATPDIPAVIRLYHPEGHYIKLSSRSIQTDPIILPYEEVAIQGVFRGLIRMYQ